MCSKGYFEILACNTKLNNNSNIQDGCMKYISNFKQDSGNEDYRNYCRTFKADETMKFIDKKPNGLNKLTFWFKVNSTEAEAKPIGVALINMNFSSPSQ